VLNTETCLLEDSEIECRQRGSWTCCFQSKQLVNAVYRKNDSKIYRKSTGRWCEHT